MNSFHESSHIQHSSSFHADGADMMHNDDEGADYYDAGDDGGDWGGPMDEEETTGAMQSAPGVDTVHPFTVPGHTATPVKGEPGAAQTKPTTSRVNTVPVKDMFAQLDPHVATSGSREARRGKTYKIPPALLKPPAISTDCMENFKHLFADYKKSNAQLLMSTGKVPITGLFDTSLLPILQRKRKQLRKERLAAVRLQRQAAAAAGSDEPIQYQNLHFSAAANTSRVEELWSQDYADYGSDGGGDFGDAGDAGGDDFDGQELPTCEGVSNALRSSGDFGDGIVGEDHQYMEESEEEMLARRVANVLNDELNQSTHTSYESICQKFIDNFNQGAHLFAK